MKDILDELAEEAEDSPVEQAPAATLEGMQMLAEEVNTLDVRIEKGEALLAELNKRKNDILYRELVEMMDQAKVESLVVGGREFAAGQHFKAVIPEDKRPEAHAWLEEHDAGDLINNEVIVAFPKGCEEESIALETYARTHYQMASVTRKQLVPWARLTSWIKELFYSKDPDKVIPPLDLMGAYIGRRVEIKKTRKGA
jgi:hypothetical protein